MGLREDTVTVTVDKRHLLANPADSLLAYDPVLEQVVRAIWKRALVDTTTIRTLPQFPPLVFVDVFEARHLKLLISSSPWYVDSKAQLPDTSIQLRTLLPPVSWCRLA